MVTQKINLDTNIYLYGSLQRGKIPVLPYLIFRILSCKGQDGRYIYAQVVNWGMRYGKAQAAGDVTSLHLTPSFIMLPLCHLKREQSISGWTGCIRVPLGCSPDWKSLPVPQSFSSWRIPAQEFFDLQKHPKHSHSSQMALPVLRGHLQWWGVHREVADDVGRSC